MPNTPSFSTSSTLSKASTMVTKPLNRLSAALGRARTSLFGAENLHRQHHHHGGLPKGPTMTAEDKTIAKIRARWAREQEQKRRRQAAGGKEAKRRQRPVDPFRSAMTSAGPGWAIGVGSGGNNYMAAL